MSALVSVGAVRVVEDVEDWGDGRALSDARLDSGPKRLDSDRGIVRTVECSTEATLSEFVGNFVMVNEVTSPQ